MSGRHALIAVPYAKDLQSSKARQLCAGTWHGILCQVVHFKDSQRFVKRFPKIFKDFIPKDSVTKSFPAVFSTVAQ